MYIIYFNPNFAKASVALCHKPLPTPFQEIGVRPMYVISKYPNILFCLKLVNLMRN